MSPNENPAARWRARPADPAEAGELARINVAGWRAAYRGILPDTMLAAMQPGDRVAGWLERARSLPGSLTVAVDGSGRIGAYCVVGSQQAHDDAPPYPDEDCGELRALYADPIMRGTGAGHVAHEAGLALLRARGLGCAVLWVLRDNENARRFYEAHDWRADGATGMFEVRGTAVAELRYHRDLR